MDTFKLVAGVLIVVLVIAVTLIKSEITVRFDSGAAPAQARELLLRYLTEHGYEIHEEMSATSPELAVHFRRKWKKMRNAQLGSVRLVQSGAGVAGEITVALPPAEMRSTFEKPALMDRFNNQRTAREIVAALGGATNAG